MRVHTNLVTPAMVHAYAAGLPGVAAKVKEHKSRTHTRGLEVHLSGNGRHGGQWGHNPDVKGATWDEWGVVLGQIFYADNGARAGGTAAEPHYGDVDLFNWRTDGRFSNAGAIPDDTHAQHKWLPHGYQGIVPGFGKRWASAECSKCSAYIRWPLS